MEYQFYYSKNYDGKWRMGVKINTFYYNDIVELSCQLVGYGVLEHGNDFIKYMKQFTKRKTLSFDSEEQMTAAKDYIESLLMMAKFSI